MGLDLPGLMKFRASGFNGFWHESSDEYLWEKKVPHPFQHASFSGGGVSSNVQEAYSA